MTTDGGFDFQPRERRERRSFEVPPWEQDAFERRREQQGEPDSPQGAGTHDLDAVLPEVAPTTAEGVAETPIGPATQAEASAGVDEKKVAVMLASLAVEDKPAGQGFWKIALGSALVLAGTGLMLLVWGMAATLKSRQTGGLGAAGGMTLTAVGGAFIAIAAYLVIKTLRDRGVL